jgi:predicted ATPase
MKPVICEIRLENLLSFGSETEPLKLGPLNVLIGPNGSGKSNLLAAIGLLQAAPKDLSAPVKETGGVRDWLWQGTRAPTATIEVVIENPDRPTMPLRHIFSFVEHGERFEVTSERIENKEPHGDFAAPYFFYKNESGFIRLKETQQQLDERDEGTDRPIRRESIKPEESVLSQVRDPERYPVLSSLSDIYSRFRLYREWSFGRYTPPRQPQKADLPSQYLSESCENLAHVLNALRPRAKDELLEALSELYGDIGDFNVQFPAGWVQLFIEEGKFSIPATRLSDGTLRYLCLLAILCHPEPPPLVCIEEPELGLHPDVMPVLAKLLIKASRRCQVIVTTHSDVLVDKLTDTPESVVVCEKKNGATVMKRLDQERLKNWLEKYSLGELWLSGEIGGTRW